MPPKRKRNDPEDSPEKEAKKETKEEKKARIEQQKLRAKIWAEERKARAAVKAKTVSSSSKVQTGQGADQEVKAATKPKRKPTTPKKKPPAAASPKSTTRKSARKVKEDVQDQEDDIPKPSAKKRRVSKAEEETKLRSEPVQADTEPLQEPKPSTSTVHTPIAQPKPTNGAAYEAPTPLQYFMSPEVIAAAKSSGSNIVFFPVNVATASITTLADTSMINGSAEVNSNPAPIPPSVIVPPSVPAPHPVPVHVAAPAPLPSPSVVQETHHTAQIPIVQVVEEEEAEDDFESDVRDTSSSAPPSLLSFFMKNLAKCILVTAAVSFILMNAALLFMDGSESPTSDLFSNGQKSSTARGEIPCFYNHGFGGEKEEMDITCDEPVGCPEYGRCEGGKLVDCLMEDINWSSGFYVPSEKGDQCVVSSGALQSMLNLHSTLTALTVEYVCRSSFGFGTVCRVPTEEQLEMDSIYFKATSVANIAGLESEQMTILLEKMENEDIVEEIQMNGDELVKYIGMSKDYINKKLPISTTCWLRIMSWDFIRVVSAFLYGFLVVILNIMWSIAVANPLPTLAVGIITYGILWVRKKRSKVSRLRKEASKIQNIAYDKLIMDCNEGEGYAALHLRDEIAHELHPEPCAARERFNSLVWPRAVVLIRSDNRVTKTRKFIGGKSLEWFEWAADSSRKSRRSLAANTVIAAEGGNTTEKPKSK